MPDKMVKSVGHSTFDLVVKKIDPEAKSMIIEGFASTPEPDRDNDIMEPGGAKFALPLPLLWQHQHLEPIGTVNTVKVSDEGIKITAEVKQIFERYKAYAEMIKQKLVRGLSLGFRGLKYAYIEGGGIHFQEFEIFEISCVTVPAQVQASITTVKSLNRFYSDLTTDARRTDDQDEIDLSTPDRPNLCKAQTYLQNMERKIKNAKLE